MIKFNNQVPSVYPNASRDFQYLGWLIDIVLNSVKHNVDDIYNLPNTKADPRLVELLAMTLGFKVKRNYDQKQLAALVAVLPRILKSKGTITAVEIAGNALVAASNTSGSFSINEASLQNGELEVVLPKELVDVSLFTDLLSYILPAGMTCRVLRTGQATKKYTTEFIHHDALLAEWIPDLAWNAENQTSTGLADMFNIGSDIGDFANYRKLADEHGNIRDENGNIINKSSLSDRFNVGLLDNTIIPALASPLVDTKSAELKNAKNNTGGNT
jgi:hypothetical protein